MPFLRHEYITAWWQGLGGGEWSHGELYVVTARREQGELIGIAPLFLTDNRDGEPALMLLGSIEISDYLDVIARPEDLPAFLEALLEHLASEQAPTFQPAGLVQPIGKQSHTCQPCKLQLKSSAGSIHSSRCSIAPISLSRVIGRSTSAVLIKSSAMRSDARCAVPMSIICPYAGISCKMEPHLEQEMDSFLDLMACDPDKAKFLTPAMRTQMHSIVQAAYKAGWLQLAFIEVNGEKAAGYLNFDYMNHIWVYNSGLDFRFSELSLGWVLLGYLLEWANEHQRQYFDFMRGDEQYKYRFGAIDRRVMRLTGAKITYPSVGKYSE